MNVFKNIVRTVAKAGKDTGRAVSKAARDTVDETNRNLKRPWEAALIGGVLTPFTGGASATLIVGAGTLASGAGARHQNIGQAFKQAGKSTIFAGAGALTSTIIRNPVGTWDKVSTAAGWTWGKVTGLVNKAGTALEHGWSAQNGGAKGSPDDKANTWPGGTTQKRTGVSGNAGGGGGGGGGGGMFGGDDAAAADDSAPGASNKSLLYVAAAVLLVIVVGGFIANRQGR